ncbi:tryptophan synthase beta subunit-like PLP-dependent enzyme [Metarhizium robertsii ARSEF 23]|uniref:Tryptophan synthase beta subunit-like PLP-dependent enzyme n=1 Tax=Metarhizium robertsii (strain ARSEF 23 / ATCC MYA-3075) TaxID=655844 RepID=E9ENJ5_METRA|nr:tryptophan synthase beta subunit-like PLP-dependent enzyme [Metarhizium robertsii ARSEF 23]EFZ04207.2 tryptophan synthase beta subunit-like PLP-dependent enzyme [Metarhizium robertsii ARSEF 23]
MANNNFLNVYKGADSVRKYFDPDLSPPLPLVEITDRLNPYYRDGVRIYAKMMAVGSTSISSMSALNLMQDSEVSAKTKTTVQYGSDLMQSSGIDITPLGGLSQPEALGEHGGVRAAQTQVEEPQIVINPSQYGNEKNWKSHAKWTGPQILMQLPEINVICAGMDTSGAILGLGTFFKVAKPCVFRLGVCITTTGQGPGDRSCAAGPVGLSQQTAVNHVEQVGWHDSYSCSLELTKDGIICGPFSGLHLRGLLQFIENRRSEGSLSSLAGPDGNIHCVFLCCDLPPESFDEHSE